MDTVVDLDITTSGRKEKWQTWMHQIKRVTGSKISQQLTCSLLSDIHVNKKWILQVIFKFGVEKCWRTEGKGSTASVVHLEAEQRQSDLKVDLGRFALYSRSHTLVVLIRHTRDTSGTTEYGNGSRHTSTNAWPGTGWPYVYLRKIVKRRSKTHQPKHESRI